MHIPRWRPLSPAHREAVPRSAQGTSRLGEAYTHLLSGQAFESADQELINRHTQRVTRFVGAYLQSEKELAEAEALGKLDKIGDIYTEEAFRAKLSQVLDPAYIGSRKPHALLVARLDDYADLCEKFGDADVEDEFLAPAAAAIKKRLSAHSFAGRLGTTELVALMPDVDLISADLLSKDAIKEVAAIPLPRRVDGFNRLGMSVGIGMITPEDNFDEVVAGIVARRDETAAFGHDILSDTFHTDIGLKRAA